MSKKKLLSFTNFDKGMNTTAFFDELSSDEVILAINVDIKARGGYTQRGGCSLYKTFAPADPEDPAYGPIHHIIDYPENPLVVIDKKLIEWDGTVLATLNSNDISWEFFTNSKLYILDGTQYWVFDGATCTAVTAAAGADLTAIKRCTKLMQRGQRMFALGDSLNPNYLYFSEIGDPTNFLATSSVKAVTDDNDVLKGIGLFSDSLLAFKDDEIFKWSGWDPTTNVVFTPLDTGHGCISHETIKVSGNYLIFADKEGVFCLNTVEKELIKTFFVSKKISSGVYDSLTDKENMRAVIYEGNYYLACCNDGTGKNNIILKAHLGLAYNDATEDGVETLLFPWVIYSGWNVSDWIIIDGKLYFTSSEGPHVYKAFDGYNDLTSPVEAKVVHYFKLEDAVTRKKLKKLFLIAMQSEEYNTNLTLTIEAGYTTITKTASLISLGESGSWDVSDWDDVLWDWVDTVVKEIRIGENINRLKVTVEHEALDESMVIYGFSAYYKTKKPRGNRNGITDIPTV